MSDSKRVRITKLNGESVECDIQILIDKMVDKNLYDVTPVMIANQALFNNETVQGKDVNMDGFTFKGIE